MRLFFGTTTRTRRLNAAGEGEEKHMQQRTRNWLAVIGCVTVVAVAAVAVPTFVLRHDVDSAAVGDTQSAPERGDSGKLLTAVPIADVDPSLAAMAAMADRITYRSTSLNGQDITVSGALLTPKGRPPEGGWPIVSWAHGSSGIADRCAPSTVLNAEGDVDLYGYGGFVGQLLAAGYAVAATDYEGLGTTGDHPYIVADSEGRGVIDAARAAIEAEPALSNKVFAVGHSQGGHAAIAAGELADSWGSGLDFRGTVGLAPVTNVGQAYSYGSPGPVDRGFYLLALTGIKTVHPDLQFDEFLGPQALAMMDKVNEQCTGDIWTQFSANLGTALSDFQFTPQTPQAALKMQGWLDEQSVPRGTSPAPMLLLQGDHDPSIRIAATRQAVQNAQAAGTEADFKLYPDQDHYSVLGPRESGGAGDDVIEWLNSHRDG
jgi:alpha-beta hydrolase superfamily lysophospholipase